MLAIERNSGEVSTGLNSHAKFVALILCFLSNDGNTKSATLGLYNFKLCNHNICNTRSAQKMVILNAYIERSHLLNLM